MSKAVKIVVFLAIFFVIFLAVFLTIFLLKNSSSASADVTTVILNTTLGQIKGLERKTPNGTVFHVFFGIPFAKPPLGELRFQAPQPAENWTEILDATNNIDICYQVNEDQPYENEDCLYLNVFTPVLDPANDEKLPVLFRIHGGGFTDGSARYNSGSGGPEWFLEQGIVVVTFNYRVGTFGFLSTGDPVLLGNAGLKDQLLALKWTNNNIASYGGDPTKITLGGQNAGGASVGFHLLSKKSAGLFRGAFSESGAPICPWSYYNGNPKEYVVSLANALNASFDESASSTDLLTYLQSVDAKAIDTVSPSLASCLPVVEIDNEDSFISLEFYEILAAANETEVPLLIGFNSEEELRMGEDLESLRKQAATYDIPENVKLLTPYSLNADPNKTEEIGALIYDLYAGNSTFESTPGLFIRYMSDVQFTKGVVEFAKLYSKIEAVYLYEFSYHGEMGQTNITIEGTERVADGEDNRFLYVCSTSGYDNTKPENFPPQDYVVHNRMISLFTNFVKFLNPTPESTELLQNITWPISNPSNLRYLSIDANLTIQTQPKEKFVSAWAEIFISYGHSPFVTY